MKNYSLQTKIYILLGDQWWEVTGQFVNKESESEFVAANVTASARKQCLHVTLEVTWQEVNVYVRKTMNTLL